MLASWEIEPAKESDLFSLGMAQNWAVAKIFSFYDLIYDSPTVVEIVYLYRRLLPMKSSWDLFQYFPSNIPSLEISIGDGQILRLALNLDPSVYPQIGRILSFYKASEDKPSVRIFTGWHANKIREFMPVENDSGLSSILLVNHLELNCPPVTVGLKVA